MGRDVCQRLRVGSGSRGDQGGGGAAGAIRHEISVRIVLPLFSSFHCASQLFFFWLRNMPASDSTAYLRWWWPAEAEAVAWHGHDSHGS
jgi:hypothetical protein